MEILTEHSNSLAEQENDPARANACDGLSLEQRLSAKPWEIRSSAFEEVFVTKDIQLISEKPYLFVHEATVRGQEAALKCILCWSHGTVSFSGPDDQGPLSAALSSYGSVTTDRIRGLLLSILRVLAQRFGASKVLGCLVRGLQRGLADLSSPKPKEPVKAPAKGAVSRQLVGCLQVISDFLAELDDGVTLTPLSRCVAELLNLTSSDRALREACYAVLAAVVGRTGGPSLGSLGLPEPQLKELRSRMSTTKDNISLVEESISTCAPSPELKSPSGSVSGSISKLALPGDWLVKATKALKWQDRRDAWAAVHAQVKSENSTLPDEIFSAISNVLKTDVNVPITVELCNLLLAYGPSRLLPLIKRQLLSVLAFRLRDKNQPVLRAAAATFLAIATSSKELLDARLIDTDLRPLVTCGKKELLRIVQQLLPLHGQSTLVLDRLVIPCLNESDLGVRDTAVLITKTLLADAASVSADLAEACCSTVFKGLDTFPNARRKVIAEALGLTVPAAVAPAPVPRSLTSLLRSPVHTEVNELVIAIRDPVPLRSGMGEKWNPETLFSELQLKRQAAEFKRLLAPESNRVADIMGQAKAFAKACKVWVTYIAADGPYLGNIVEDLFKWIVVGLGVNGQPATQAALHLLEIVLGKLDRPLTSAELGVIVPMLIDRAAVDLTFRSLFDRVRVMPDQAEAVTKLLSRSALKTKNPKVGELCVSALLDELERKNLRATKHVALKAVMTFIHRRKTSDVTIFRRLQTLIGRDAELAKMGAEVVQTDMTLKNTSVASLFCHKPQRRSADHAVAPCLEALHVATGRSDSEAVNTAVDQVRDLLFSTSAIEGQAANTALTLSALLKPVLDSSSSCVRQAVIGLIHDVCRSQQIWPRVPRQTLFGFLHALLLAVADKDLRSSEPEVWADLNLSVVHAIANSHRPTAYAALLQISKESLLANLAVRCLEKINRSLPQYLAAETSGNLNGLLRAFQSHIHSLCAELGETAVVNDECVMTCLKGICGVVGLVEVGEFVGLHVAAPEERLLWKRLLKTYSAAEKRRKSSTE